jgi:RNA methyltransferase, TrmH family
MKAGKKNHEMKVYGRNAVRALFEQRPRDIIRVYLTQEDLRSWKDLTKFCVDHKLAYHVVEREELDTIARATHHEGVVILVKQKPKPQLEELLKAKGRALILALEEVENPHNLGAIMRSAAHFGVQAILYQAKVPVAQTSAAFRTAEGGAEAMATLQVEDWKPVLELARARGFHTFATSGHQGQSLFATSFPEKTILFLGAEGEGLSKALGQRLDAYLSIPGSGAVESLNVSNATVAILTEWYRQGLEIPNK